MKALHRKRTGFSIVEMIVVLALSAMITALIMPAVFMTREDSKKYVCMQHLHQVAAQGQVFMQDRVRGNFPALNMSLAPNEDKSINVQVTRRSDYSGGWGYFNEKTWEVTDHPPVAVHGTITPKKA